jgi:hypothetical protein
LQYSARYNLLSSNTYKGRWSLEEDTILVDAMTEWKRRNEASNKRKNSTHLYGLIVRSH